MHYMLHDINVSVTGCKSIYKTSNIVCSGIYHYALLYLQQHLCSSCWRDVGSNVFCVWLLDQRRTESTQDFNLKRWGEYHKMATFFHIAYIHISHFLFTRFCASGWHHCWEAVPHDEGSDNNSNCHGRALPKRFWRVSHTGSTPDLHLCAWGGN